MKKEVENKTEETFEEIYTTNNYLIATRRLTNHK